MSMDDVMKDLKAVNAKYQMFHAMSDDTAAGDAKFLFSANDNLTS